jgi:hypothetical protein
MRFDRIANCALAGVVIAALSASAASAGVARYCWRSNNKTVCVDSAGKPVDCKTRPCVVTASNGHGGNNKPVLERPANAVSVAAKDDISVGLNMQKFRAGPAASVVNSVAAPKMNAPTAAQGPR